VKDKEHHVLIAYRDNGNPETENGEYGLHTQLFSQKIKLWNDSNCFGRHLQQVGENTDDVYSVNLGFNKLALPRKETFYACRYFNLTQMLAEVTGLNPGIKYHAIGYEPRIDKVKRLHHIVIYDCPNGFNSHRNDTYDCTDEQMWPCNKLQVAWTVGMKPITLPPEAGTLLGTDDTSIVKLQVHYHNPELLSGEVDSSNMTIKFTPKLRQYNTGIMVLGKYQKVIRIPPGLPDYTVRSKCTSNCTSKMGGKINVINFLVHGHLTAKSIYSDIHTSSGQNVTLGDSHYSFHAQRLQSVEPMLTLEPGFSATTTCVYNSVGRNNTVYGGLGTHDEMCYNFIMYYPKENGLAFCIDGDFGDIGCIKN
jgi:dopamine beta-monooxygenase